MTSLLAAAYPSWPARVRYAVWRQARGTSEEVVALLPQVCEDVKTAAEILGLGGGCAAAAAGTVAGTVEGSAAEVLRMVSWLKRSFHWYDVGFGPELLGPGDPPRSGFSV